MATTAAEAGMGGSGQSDEQKMLSAKVTRTLDIRTDTPAMKAALDALANLPNHKDELHSIDSRSIRVAIEQDALQQAMLLQNELSTVLDKVVSLRTKISETTEVARLVSDAINTGVVDDADNVNAAASIEQERELASSLSTAFHQLSNAKQRVETVNAFLEKYNLSEEDSRLLDHYDFEDVETSNVNGTAFLNALERIQEIRNELSKSFGSGSLLQQQHGKKSQSSESLGTSSALMMIETLAQKQERAYERLYHWLQSFLQLKSNNSGNKDSDSATAQEDRLDELLTHPFVKRSLVALREQPAFYSYLLELVATSRRSVESRRFLLALTSGYDGSPPIEMRAHDAVAYTADMLAFCFRAYSVEADVARGLFDTSTDEGAPGSSDEGNTNGPKSGEGEEEEKRADAYTESEFATDKHFSAVEMLNHAMSGVARPLQARIQQVISTLARRPDEVADGNDDDDDGFMDDEENGGSSTRARLSQLYEICGLLLFYISAIAKVERKLQQGSGGDAATNASTAAASAGLTEETENAVLKSMMECLKDASTAYEASLRVYCAMLEQLTVVGGESEAALCHMMFAQLVQVREASPGFSQDVECPSIFEGTLSLQWASQLLIESSLPVCKTLDDTVYVRQTLSASRKAGVPTEASGELQLKVNEKETALIDALVETEAESVLELCGLGSVFKPWKDFESTRIDGMSMSSYPGLAMDEMEMSVKEFYESLYAPPIPSFETTIKDPGLRKLARSKIAEKVCQIYSDLYAEVKMEVNGYDDLSFLIHTPEQVRTLMSV